MGGRKQGNDRGGAPGRLGVGQPRETAGRTGGSSDPEEQHAAERGVGAATRLNASGAGCDESSPHHADGSFRQGRPRLRETPNVGAYLIKAGHEQRHEGRAAREVLSATQEERTSEGRTPQALPA